MPAADKHNTIEDEIPLNKICIGTHQARVADAEGQTFEALKLNIRTNGLLQRIGLCKAEEGPFEYECIWGQRRYNAYLQLLEETKEDRFREIPAVVFEDSNEAVVWQGLSIAENTGQEPMTRADLQVALSDLYEKLGNYAEIERKTGIASHLVREYVKVARLCTKLKDKVRNEGLNQNTAVSIQDACETSVGVDEKRIDSLVKAMGKLDNVGAKKLVKRAKKARTASISDLVKTNDRPVRSNSITMNVNDAVMTGLSEYQESNSHGTPAESALNLIVSGLVQEGLVDKSDA